MATGDVNLGGKLDLVIPNETSNNVTILLGNGAGGFSSSGVPDINVGNRPQSVAIGDWNGVTKPDLAVANPQAGSSLRSCSGTASGAFAPAMGLADFALGESVRDRRRPYERGRHPRPRGGSGRRGHRRDLSRERLGGFSQIGGWPLGGSPSSLAGGDLNADGKLDLVGTNSGSDDVSVLLGIGSGNFMPAPSGRRGDGPVSGRDR